MLGVSKLIVNIVPGEIGHRLVNIETERLICRAAGNRDGEREALSFAVRTPILPISERLRKVNGTRTAPVQAKGSVGHLVKQVQVLDRSVIEAVSRANAGLARSTKNLPQGSITEVRRIGQTEARPEIVVSDRKSVV